MEAVKNAQLPILFTRVCVRVFSLVFWKAINISKKKVKTVCIRFHAVQHCGETLSNTKITKSTQLSEHATKSRYLKDKGKWF